VHRFLFQPLFGDVGYGLLGRQRQPARKPPQVGGESRLDLFAKVGEPRKKGCGLDRTPAEGEGDRPGDGDRAGRTTRVGVGDDPLLRGRPYQALVIVVKEQADGSGAHGAAGDPDYLLGHQTRSRLYFATGSPYLCDRFDDSRVACLLALHLFSPLP
jgi:hypothetical protein